MKPVQEYEQFLLEEELLLSRLRVGGRITEQELGRIRQAVEELLKALLGDTIKPPHLVMQNLDQAQGIWKSLARKHPLLLKEEGWTSFLKGTAPDVYAEWQSRRSAELMRARHGQQVRQWSPRAHRRF